MENEIYSSERPVLSLSYDAENFLVTAARWAKFLGIMGFVSAGLVMISALFIGVVTTMMSGLMGTGAMPVPPIVLSLVYVVVGGVYFLVALFLYKFGVTTQRALENRSETYLTDGLKSLKTHFTIIGVLAIVGLSLMVLMFLAFIVGLAVSASGTAL